jgi:hypothetical protein
VGQRAKNDSLIPLGLEFCKDYQAISLPDRRPQGHGPKTVDIPGFLLDFYPRFSYLLLIPCSNEDSPMTLLNSQLDRSSLSRNVLIFISLLVISLIFFSLVRDNSFWHSGDYSLLDESLDTEANLAHIFNTDPRESFQPLVRLVFYLEYLLFKFDAWKYYLFNVFIHSINAFLVYLLLITLLRDKLIAVLSAVLFACAVGNYGKAVMVVSGISDLLIAMLTLLTLLFYFKNELQKGGRSLSFWFFACLVFFVLGMTTKTTSFSVLGCMLAFNVFYRSETKKRILHRNFIILGVVALIALTIKLSLLPEFPGRRDMTLSLLFFRNFGSYLVRMVFPIHASQLVEHAGPIVRFVYELASEIRVLTFLCILSYSVFGFIFGNRTIRFFICWTYITVTPFCFFKFPADWLNIRHLYLVSIGYSMLLASGTVLASHLLYQKAWRRFIPYVLPLLFVVLSQFIIFHLDKNYEQAAESERMREMRSYVISKYDRMRGAEVQESR